MIFGEKPAKNIVSSINSIRIRSFLLSLFNHPYLINKIMGSTESKEYTIPKSAYDNLANRRNVPTHSSSQYRDAATQHSDPSNLTMQQQQLVDDALRKKLDDIERSKSTTQKLQSTNDATCKELNNFPTSKSTTQKLQSTNDATCKEFNHFPRSKSTIQKLQSTNDAACKEFNNFPTSKSTTQKLQSTNDTTYEEIDNFTTSNSTIKQQKSTAAKLRKDEYESYNSMKQTPQGPITRKTKKNNKNALNTMIKAPEKLNNLDDFMKNWNIWKEQLKSFLTLMDEKKLNYNQWGNFFLHFMGPFSQEILNELFFSKEEDKKNYKVLLQKYNAFYKFHTTLKSKNENTIEYIEKLKGDVAQNFKNVDITIKNKIAQEIKNHYKERFVALAKSKLPKFKFETTFTSLTLAEIGFLWKNCEESNLDSNRDCIYCGLFHQEGKCSASNYECKKCKNIGHFTDRCPIMNIIDCNFCGGNHKRKQCPSYGETCSKCGRSDHFSWKCPKLTIVKDCRFCGLDHLMSRYACPAKNNFCSICERLGHYYNKCTKIQNVVQNLEID